MKLRSYFGDPENFQGCDPKWYLNKFFLKKKYRSENGKKIIIFVEKISIKGSFTIRVISLQICHCMESQLGRVTLYADNAGLLYIWSCPLFTTKSYYLWKMAEILTVSKETSLYLQTSNLVKQCLGVWFTLSAYSEPAAGVRNFNRNQPFHFTNVASPFTPYSESVGFVGVWGNIPGMSHFKVHAFTFKYWI